MSYTDQEIAAYKAGVLAGSDKSTSVHQEIIRSLQMFAGLNSDQAHDVMEVITTGWIPYVVVDYDL